MNRILDSRITTVVLVALVWTTRQAQMSLVHASALQEAAERLHKFFSATVELMSVLARACGHTHLSEFCTDDLTTFDREMHHLTGIAYGGVSG